MKGGFSKGDIDNKAPAISSQGEPGVQDKGPLFIAVIGASAGGIEALKQFMAAWDELADEQKHLWILVIIQHLSPEHPSMMDRLLQRHSRIPISYAQEGGLAQAGNCYLIPSHADITLCNGRFALAPRPKRNQLHHPIDRFVLSLGDDFAQRSAVIICSGSGSDGTLGCEYIANKRGAVWVQSPREASFVQMPKSVLEHVPQARAASLNDIPRFLTNERALAAYDEKQGSTHSTGDSSESDLEKLIKQLQREHRLHWHHYHEATLMRQMDQGRLRRELDSLDEYTHLCTIDCDERSQLARDILVNVTEFFRDPECFAALGDLLRSQLKDHPKGEEYRAWIAGCATGEEAYSIAMLIDEVQEALGTEHEVRLWATDIHPDSVRFASRGVYRIEHLNGLNEERRNRYLSMEHLHGTIIPKIRNRIVFAPHNLLSDPPFLHLNLLSCRNVLIYLRDSSRNALLHRFSTALAPGSLLMLGRSEHINTAESSLEACNRQLRIFRKTESTRYNPIEDRVLPQFITSQTTPSISASSSTPRGTMPAAATSRNRQDDGLGQILSHCVGTGFLVDNEGLPHRLFGDAGKWFSLEGRISGRLIDLLPKPIALTVENLLIQAAQERDGCLVSGYVTTEAGAKVPTSIQVTVRKIPQEDEGGSLGSWFFVGLHEGPRMMQKDKTGEVESDHQHLLHRIHELEAELNRTQSVLISTRQDLANSNEELQTTIEELHASNEELQSSNEELQSLNEELHSSNAELLSKNDLLNHLNADLEHLLSANDTPKIFLDAKGHIRRFTKAAPRLFYIRNQDVGRPINEITGLLGEGKRIGDILLALHQAEADKGEMTEKEGAKRTDSYMSELTTASGHWYLERIHINRNEDGAIFGFALSWIDIHWLKSSQQQLEEDRKLLAEEVSKQTAALQTERDRIQALSNASPVMLWMCDSHDNFTHVSKAAWEYCGDLKTVSNLRDSWLHLTHPEDIAREKERYFSDIEQRRPFARQWRVRRHDGVYRWFKSQGIPRFDKQGNYLGFAGGLVDIDDEVRLRAESQQLLERLNLIVEGAGVGIWEWDVKTDTVFWNPQLYRLHDFPPPDDPNAVLSPDDAKEAVHPEDREQWSQIVSLAMQNNADGHYHIVFRPNNNAEKTRWILGIGQVYRDQNGDISRLSGICLDITTQRELEEHLSAALKEAQQAVEDKGRFLTTMSHELRTPLNGILGLGEHLLNHLDNEQQRSWLTRILNAGKGLLQLINDTLEFSRLQSGRLTLRPKPCHLPTLIDHLSDLYDPLSVSKDTLTIAWRINDDCHEWVFIDAQRLEQIIHNLVGNAIKFTQQGRVDVSLSWQKTGSENGLVLRIADSGVGIAQEDLQHLGEEFFQAARGQSLAATPGTGLGLSIVNGLVKLMHGQWDVQSTLSQGTVVQVYLPCEPCAPLVIRTNETAGPVLTVPDCSDYTILVADDNDLNLEILQHMLNDTRARILCAQDGLEALSQSQGESIDLMLLDIQMPHMGGIEVCRALRSKGNQTPMVAITAADDHNLHALCKEAGLWGILEKPLERTTLFATLREILDCPDMDSPQQRNQAKVEKSLASQLSLYLHKPEFNVLLGLRLCEQNETFYLRMLERFQHQVEQRFSDLFDNHAVPLSHGLRRLIHTMKGSASAVGAHRITNACTALLDEGNADNAVIEARLRELSAALLSTKQQLCAWAHSELCPTALTTVDPESKDALVKVVDHLHLSAWINDDLCDKACAFVNHCEGPEAAAILRGHIHELRHADALAFIFNLPKLCQELERPSPISPYNPNGTQHEHTP